MSEDSKWPERRSYNTLCKILHTRYHENLEVYKLFNCLPNGSKCEWQHLKNFIPFIEKKLKTTCISFKCLDVFDSSRPLPEVLITTNSSNSIVIEHKNVVWPNDKIKRHHYDHVFVDKFIESFNTESIDGKYILNIRFESNCKFDELEEYANNIASEIHLKYDELKEKGHLQSSNGEWIFLDLEKHKHLDEWDTKSGVGVRWMDNNDSLLLYDMQKECSDVENTIVSIMRKIESKFEDYSSLIKVLVIANYTEQMEDSDFKKIIEHIDVPNYIDQIWLEDLMWVDYDKSRINYKCIYETTTVIG